MNFIERWFRRRAIRRPVAAEAKMSPALQAVPIGTIVPINGWNYRVAHKRESGGRHPGLVLALVGPTRKRLKHRRQQLRAALRFGRRS